MIFGRNIYNYTHFIILYSGIGSFLPHCFFPIIIQWHWKFSSTLLLSNCSAGVRVRPVTSQYESYDGGTVLLDRWSFFHNRCTSSVCILLPRADEQALPVEPPELWVLVLLCVLCAGNCDFRTVRASCQALSKSDTWRFR